MPKAAKRTTTSRAVTRGPDLSPVIAQMRAIAARSGDSLLLADGPPHPDFELLDVCGEALHYLMQYEAALERWRNYIPVSLTLLDPPYRERAETFEARAKQLMRRAGKLRATSPAGIYAKALLVRASATGAAVMAKSLAEELVACAPLRESLWPAAREPA